MTLNMRMILALCNILCKSCFVGSFPALVLRFFLQSFAKSFNFSVASRSPMYTCATAYGHTSKLAYLIRRTLEGKKIVKKKPSQEKQYLRKVVFFFVHRYKKRNCFDLFLMSKEGNHLHRFIHTALPSDFILKNVSQHWLH